MSSEAGLVVAFVAGGAALPVCWFAFQLVRELRELWKHRDFYTPDHMRPSTRWVLWLFKRLPKRKQ